MSTHPNFETQVIEGLANLTAKMDMLVGEHGTNGRFGTVEEKVAEHDQFIQQQKGANGAANDRRVLWGTVLIGIANVAAILYHLTH